MQRRHLIPRVIALAACLAPVAGAQDLLERECLPAYVAIIDPAMVPGQWAPYLPGTLAAAADKFFRAGKFSEGLSLVAGKTIESTMLVNDTARRNPLLRRIKTVSANIGTLANETDPQKRAALVSTTVKQTDFMIAQNPMNGAIRIGSGNEIVMKNVDDEDTRRGLCWSALAMHATLAMYVQPALEATATALAKLSERWDGYGEGYSQFPWELALNSKLYDPVKRGYQPPDKQVILLHPSGGLQMAGATPRDLRRVDVVMMEVLGFVNYSGDYKRYWGASIVGTASSTMSPTYGAFAHLWWPNMTMGATFGAEKGSWRPSYLVSVDLYDILTGVPGKIREAADAAKAGKIASIVP